MKSEVFNDLESMLKVIKNDNCNDRYSWMKQSNTYGKISKCYAFSNEDLNWYYPFFDINDNNVLTVCGSGDQVLSAILYGAKSVDTFDSNKISYYHLMLKISAIKSLEYRDFMKFYTLEKFHEERNNYCKVIIQNIIDDDIRLFWDQIFLDKKNFPHCFIDDYVYPSIVADQIPYLNEKNYNILKSKIAGIKINFQNVDLFNTVDVFDKKYSFINLSNILYYISDKQAFINFIHFLSLKNLQNKGSILLNYYWDHSDFNDQDLSIYESLNAYSYNLNYEKIGRIFQKEIKVYTKHY